MFNKLSWNDEWVREATETLEEVLRRATSSPARNYVFGQLLNDAVQAHRPWALDVQREATQRGLGSILRSYTQSRGGTLPFKHGGELHLKSAIVGIERTGDNGETWIQQELLARATFREIAANRARDLKIRKAYSVRVAMEDRLLALEEMAPGTETPDEACAQLGISLDDYLGGGELAA